MVKSWNIIPKGRLKIMSTLRDYDFDGFVESVELQNYRMINEYSGTATFGVKLRGITAGNINLEIPLAFDASKDKVSEPVVVYYNGDVITLSQGFFDRVFGSINLTKQVVPPWGWMERDDLKKSMVTFVLNPPNKYEVGETTKYSSNGSMSSDHLEAFKRFVICYAAGEETILDAVSNDASLYKEEGLELGDALFRLLTSYLGQASVDEIADIAQDTYYKAGALRDTIRTKAVALMKQGFGYQDIINRLSTMFATIELGEVTAIVDSLIVYAHKRLAGRTAQDPEMEAWWEEAEELPMLEELPDEEEIIELTDEVFEEEPLIEVPVEYERIIFPTPYQLQQLIKLYRVIRFTYKKLNDEFTMREVEPHYLWITGKGNIVMISWDFLRGDWRAFDINRVRDVDVSYFGEWKEMGEFMAMVEDARAKGLEPPINYRDIFSPRGPYSEDMTTHRLHSALMSTSTRFGSVLRDQTRMMAQIFGGLL